jgi:hypothetical protein
MTLPISTCVHRHTGIQHITPNNYRLRTVFRIEVLSRFDKNNLCLVKVRVSDEETSRAYENPHTVLEHKDTSKMMFTAG